VLQRGAAEAGEAMETEARGGSVAGDAVAVAAVLRASPPRQLEAACARAAAAAAAAGAAGTAALVEAVAMLLREWAPSAAAATQRRTASTHWRCALLLELLAVLDPQVGVCPTSSLLRFGIQGHCD
jgi:hypothetical protein